MASTQTAQDTIVSLWRYPVKSMMGEELNAAEITELGLVGDRAYALIDNSDGKVVSAKNPRKWPELFHFRAAFVQPPQAGAKSPPVRITLPEGTIVTAEQADVDEVLSNALSRKVTLGAADRTRAKAGSSSGPDGMIDAAEEYWPDIASTTGTSSPTSRCRRARSSIARSSTC